MIMNCPTPDWPGNNEFQRYPRGARNGLRMSASMYWTKKQRETEEENSGIAGAQFIPIEELRNRVGEVPNDRS